MEEGFTASTYKGIQGYWRHHRYHGRRRTKLPEVHLGTKGDASNSKRPFWRIKPKRRLKLKLKLKLRFSPKKFLAGLRDRYVNLMLKFSNSLGMGGGYGLDGGTRFVTQRIKEYDEKMIIEIYKSIVLAERQLAHRDAAGGSLGSDDPTQRRR